MKMDSEHRGLEDQMSEWWSSSIIEMSPGVIKLRGHDIAQLINEWDFASTIWLMVRGTPPLPKESRLLTAALIASVDHGPQAPSIAAARMAATCGVGLNSALATGINLLGDVHGGQGSNAWRY